jgi:hypothetical protein
MIYSRTFYEEGAAQMDLERAIPRGRRGLQEWREHRIARIVHQNIDAAKRLDGALDHGLDLVLARHIGLYRDGSPPQALNLRGRLLRALPVIIATWSVSCITLPPVCWSSRTVQRATTLGRDPCG